jgi:hypothetical protein
MAIVIVVCFILCGITGSLLAAQDEGKIKIHPVIRVVIMFIGFGAAMMILAAVLTWIGSIVGLIHV